MISRARQRGLVLTTAAVAFVSVVRAALPAIAHDQTAGELDNTFGTDGMVVTDFNGIDSPTDMVIQPDGKIVVVGFNLLGDSGSFAMARYLPDGALDHSFGRRGRVVIDPPIGSSLPDAVALQNNGKVLVAGTTNAFGRDEFILGRFLANGRLDPRFGKHGFVTTEIGVTATPAAVAVQSDGKIVVAGTSIIGKTSNDFAVVRYRRNGTLDHSFGKNGRVTTDFNGGQDLVEGMILQPNGQIVVAGWADDSGEPQFAMTRYNSDGALDPGFWVTMDGSRRACDWTRGPQRSPLMPAGRRLFWRAGPATKVVRPPRWRWHVTTYRAILTRRSLERVLRPYSLTRG